MLIQIGMKFFVEEPDPYSRFYIGRIQIFLDFSKHEIAVFGAGSKYKKIDFFWIFFFFRTPHEPNCSGKFFCQRIIFYHIDIVDWKYTKTAKIIATGQIPTDAIIWRNCFSSQIFSK